MQDWYIVMLACTNYIYLFMYTFNIPKNTFFNNSAINEILALTVSIFGSRLMICVSYKLW